MPSNAYSVHLSEMLSDANELDKVYARLRAASPGRPLGLASLNRAIVIMSISAWVSYVEELMRESLDALRPPNLPSGAWQVLNAYVTGLLRGFNTPNRENVERLVRSCLGLADVHLSWSWRNCPSNRAVQRLTEAMNFRHQIAHGANPRPVILHQVSSQLQEFIRRLARCTDNAVRKHLINVHGIANPWPP